MFYLILFLDAKLDTLIQYMTFRHFDIFQQIANVLE